MKKIFNFILVGCGPHYQKHYHPLLEEKGLNMALLIDLKSRKDEIGGFFEGKKLKPKSSIYLDDSMRDSRDLSPIIESAVDPKEIDGILLCTEPKARYAYIMWAIENQIPLYMDKPISAFLDLESSDTIKKDFEEITTALKEHPTNIVVSCQRRMHAGYQWIFSHIQRFMEKYHVPITSIDIQFSGGIWNLPEEYLERESHPFKYGYGILLHSGYHYLDLLTSLLKLNAPFHKETPKKEYQLLKREPYEQTHTLGKESLSHLLRSKQDLDEKALLPLKDHGETDLFITGRETCSSKFSTLFSLRLIGTSLSSRSPKKSLLKLDGKLRQETVTIHLGTLCSVHITSLPFNKIDPKGHPIENFDITIMTSPILEDEKTIIRLGREDFFPPDSSLNREGRKRQLLSFLEGGDGASNILSHGDNIKMLDSIYALIKKDLSPSFA